MGYADINDVALIKKKGSSTVQFSRSISREKKFSSTLRLYREPFDGLIFGKIPKAKNSINAAEQIPIIPHFFFMLPSPISVFRSAGNDNGGYDVS